MYYLLDLIIILIIVLFVFLSARRGFVRTVIEFAGYILAIALSFTISTPLGKLTYDKIIEPPILQAAQNGGIENINDFVDKTWDALPDYIVNNAESFGITKQALGDAVSGGDAAGYSKAAAEAVSQNAIKPAVSKFISLCYALIMLTVLLFVVRIIARLVNRLFSFRLVGTLNRILGGAVGLLKGIMFAALFVSVISVIITLTKDGFWIFTRENIAQSYIFKFFAQASPFEFFPAL